VENKHEADDDSEFDRLPSWHVKVQMVCRVVLIASFALLLVVPLKIEFRMDVYRFGLFASAIVFVFDIVKKNGPLQFTREYFEKLKSDWNSL
jgi:hypothetical protein